MSNKTLSDEQIDVLRRWIEEGASWDQHWSFAAIERQAVPAVRNEAWGRNPIDRFVLARLKAKNLRPAPEADKRTLARRVALDLTGLPPDPGTLATFLSDTSDQAYEGMVDRLLGSRHWGEHRARYWLDAARYGDTHGIHIDNYREMYAYRDWVIGAFNDNKPFDEFTVEQVAGDLLPEPTLDQLIATGFQRNNITTNEGGVVPEEYEAIYARLQTRAASVDPTFVEWLTRGQNRALGTPLEPSAELLTLVLRDAGGPAVWLDGERRPITVQPGAVIEDGPNGLPALMFDADSWAELPSLALDSDTPFSMALWIYQPEDEGNFVVAGQYDQEDGSRGWAMTISARQLSFRLTGDRAAPGRGATSARVGPINTKRMPTGEWTHIVVTHDGTAERAGLHVYRNGELVEEQGSEFFAKAEGSILTDQPFYLGRGDAVSRTDEPEIRHFGGGGVADVRLLNRALTVEETQVVFRWRALQRAVAKSPEALTGDERDTLRLRYLSIEDDAYRQLVARKQDIEREWREVRRRGTVTHVMQEIAGSEPEAHVLILGMYDQRAARVVAGTPAALPPMAESLPRNRLGLARWLVDEANPLTTRVTVNRFWQQVFGTGLVATSEDFGAQGEPPSHPELLDWLAVEFRESGWDVKRFFRTLVTSATYRQAATITADTLERDPQNRPLSRGPRFRMDAEMVRDSALAASGLLVRTIGGPSVKPYQPAGVWSTVAMPQSNTRRYEQDTGDKLYRRSLYTFWKRSAPPASMDIFNAPTREHSTVRRVRTNTPLQALVTMNDTQFVEASRYLAQRAMREAGDDFDRRLDYVTTRLLARDFTDQERAVAKRTYDRFVDLYRADADAARRLLDVGESPSDDALPPTESAAWTMLASQVMNLDEVLNK